jgi:hypothetical protein
VNFYRRFLPGIPRTLQPLTDALRGAPKTLEWPAVATAAFGAAKAALAAAVPLAHPAPNAVLSLSIADAQPVNFSAMVTAQRSCPEVAEMMNSTTLQITTQAVRDDTLLGAISTGVFRPLVPIQHRETAFHHYTPYTTPECGRSAASSPLGSAGHRWPRP